MGSSELLLKKAHIVSLQENKIRQNGFWWMEFPLKLRAQVTQI